MNLVIIGNFKDAKDALEVERAFRLLKEASESSKQQQNFNSHRSSSHFTAAIRSLLTELNLWTLRPDEVEQFGYDISLKRKDSQLHAWTDEADVSALVKLFLEHGAKIELFSAHSHPENPENQEP